MVRLRFARVPVTTRLLPPTSKVQQPTKVTKTTNGTAKGERAKQTRARILKRIERAKQLEKRAELKAAKARTSEEGKEADELIFEAQQKQDYWQRSLRFATGEFAFGDIERWVGSKVSGRVTRDIQKREFKRLVKEEVKQREAEGFETVYGKQRGLTKEVLGFRKEVKEELPQEVTPIIQDSILEDKDTTTLPERVKALQRGDIENILPITPKRNIVEDISLAKQFVVEKLDVGAEKLVGFQPEMQINFKQSKILGLGFPTIIGLGKPDTEGTISFSEIEESLKSGIQQTTLQEIKGRGIVEEVQPQFTFVQTKFEEDFGGRIQSGELTFEQAREEFKQTPFFKEASEKFSIEVEKQLKESGFGSPSFLFTKRGIGLGLRTLGLMGTSLVPKTFGETVIDASLTAGFLKGVQTFPKLSTALFGVEGIKSGFELFQPQVLPQERIESAVTFTAIAGAGAIGGIRKLKQPKIFTETIKVPEILTESQKRTKVSNILDTKVVTVGGKSLQIDMVKFSKLGEQATLGERAFLTTRFRQTFGLPPIKRDKALKKLQNLGLTELQSKEALRFIQPKLKTFEITGKAFRITGGELKQPQIKITSRTVVTPQTITLDGGFKTRGGIRDIIFQTGKGKQIGDASFRTFFTTEKASLTPEGFPFTRVSRAGRLRTQFEKLSIADFIGSGELGVTSKRKGIKITKQLSTDVFFEKSLARQIHPKLKGFKRGTETIEVLKTTRQPFTTFIDFDAGLGIKTTRPLRPLKPSKVKRSFDTKNIDSLVKDLKNIYGKPQVQQVGTPILERGFIPPISSTPVLKPSTKRKVDIKQINQQLTTDLFSSKQRAGLALSTRQFGKTATKTDLRVRQATGIAQQPTTKITTRFIQGTVQQPRTRITTTQIPKFKLGLETAVVPTITTTPTLVPTPPTPLVPTRTFLFPLDLPTPKRTPKRKRRVIKSPFIDRGFFQPSLAAISLGIKAPKMPSSLEVAFFRPIVTGRKKKRRRRK
jgi:hypothetical protein